jgi:hypothetical protein
MWGQAFRLAVGLLVGVPPELWDRRFRLSNAHSEIRKTMPELSAVVHPRLTDGSVCPTTLQHPPPGATINGK